VSGAESSDKDLGFSLSGTRDFSRLALRLKCQPSVDSTNPENEEPILI
jgi:hypothetical protein